MSFYLNDPGVYYLFRRTSSMLYFVDKSELIAELVPMTDLGAFEEVLTNRKENSRYIAIIRPRRFGKTVNANMITAFFEKGVDSHRVFDDLQVSKYPWYRQHLNQHNVIHIMLNELAGTTETFSSFIDRIQEHLLDDLITAYPNAGIHRTDAAWDALKKVNTSQNGEKFIFVLDEWDYIYHQSFVTDYEKEKFTRFLSNLLKDKPYVEMAYMTGILPIAKYSEGSDLNMFSEYTFASEARFSRYFGFLDSEVDELYSRYLTQPFENREVTREGLRTWYDGYQTRNGERVCNPRSVVLALENNHLANYWTTSGPYEELFSYVKANVDGVREDIRMLLSDIPVPVKGREYASVSMTLDTRDEIFSAMIVYGFLNYSDGCVSIPNKELMDEFTKMAEKEGSLGYVYQLANASGQMLRATKELDTLTMEEILSFVHDTESPLTVYSNEDKLASIIRLAYLNARDFYRIEREEKAGVGFVDFIFYPFVKSDDAIIIELKVNSTPEEAIEQIRDRKYALRFEDRFGERPEYTGRILAVGIAYDKSDTAKKHKCRVEILRDRGDVGKRRTD